MYALQICNGTTNELGAYPIVSTIRGISQSDAEYTARCLLNQKYGADNYEIRRIAGNHGQFCNAYWHVSPKPEAQPEAQPEVTEEPAADFQRGEAVTYTARPTRTNLRYIGTGSAAATVVRTNPDATVVIDIPFAWNPFGDYWERGTVRRTVKPSSLSK